MQVVVLDASMTVAWCFLDAAYLSVALLEEYPLVSLDEALIRAAAAADIEIFQPSGSFLQ